MNNSVSSGAKGTPPVVNFQRVAHSFGPTQALRDISLTVGRGERVAISGPSGCGKSTIVQLAAGLFLPTHGTTHLLGHNLFDLTVNERARLRRTRVSLILQFGQLVPEMTVLENVALPLVLEGRRPKEAADQAMSALEAAGVKTPPGIYSHELSGGQAQRVAVARALVTQPELILADEPTASLDTVGGEEVMDLLTEYSQRHAAALILVTHNNLIAASMDREVRLGHGVVVSQGINQGASGEEK